MRGFENEHSSVFHFIRMYASPTVTAVVFVVVVVVVAAAAAAAAAAAVAVAVRVAVAVAVAVVVAVVAVVVVFVVLLSQVVLLPVHASARSQVILFLTAAVLTGSGCLHYLTFQPFSCKYRGHERARLLQTLQCTMNLQICFSRSFGGIFGQWYWNTK